MSTPGPYWKQAQNERTQADEPVDGLHTTIGIVILSVCGLVLVVALLAGNWVTKIAVALLVACVVQGLFRGATKIAGLLVALLLAGLLALPLGRMLDGVIGGLTRTSGITARAVSIGVVSVLVLIATTPVVNIAAKRLIKAKPGWKWPDRYIGAGLGLVEGVFLSLLLMWAPLALEPVAALRDANMQGQDPLAKRLLSLADQVRGSSLGRAAGKANPVANSEIFQLARDFAAVSSSDAALAHFIESEPIQKLRNEPQLKQLLAKLEQDPAIAKLRESTGVMTPETIQTLLGSEALMQAIDQTDVRSLLLPAAGDIKKALQEAREKADAPRRK